MNRLVSRLRDRPWRRMGLPAQSLARACTFMLVIALAVTVTAWVLEFSARRTPSEPVRPVIGGDSAPRTQAAEVAPIAYLFGAVPGADGADIKLVGVIAQGKQGKGVALLAVDGRPPLALRAGEEIAAGVTLAEVRGNGVVISRGGAVQEIRMPAKPAPEGIVKVR
ncbi:MAG TPA: type II secretion system protein N [Burkholderiales bacterium]